MPSHPEIIAKVYDCLLYLLPLIEKFPKPNRYLLGERIENTIFDILEIILEANYSKEKLPLLERANLKLEQARYYVRLCKDLKLADLHCYEVISRKINEIGVQLGGWMKQQKTKS